MKSVKIKIEPPGNPLDWYTLTETTNTILNELLAYAGREEFKETKKEVPDQCRIKQLRAFTREIQVINREPDNFKSAPRMREIIDKYAPLVRIIYNEDDPPKLN